MSDNVTLPGTNAVIATDDVGGAQVQIIKSAYGSDGVATVMDVKPATEATAASILAKLITSPATETTTSAILAKLIASPATEATAAAILAKFITTLPTEYTSFLPISQVPQKTSRIGFDSTIASGTDSNMSVVATGAGMTVSQSNGSLLVTSGTTAYAETILRSVASFGGSFKTRHSVTLSQRIANCEAYLELVDVIGDGLTIVHNSTTSVTVTIPSNPFTSANVGQGIYIGAISTASSLNQRATIASVSGNDVTFTGAGFAATGTGTCSLFGWNYHHVYYDGTTATSTKYATQRNGWTAGDITATINTTASGHIGLVSSDAAKSGYFDQLSASSTTAEVTQRASSVRNVPEDQITLRYQIRVRNLSTAPASTTTLTVGFLEVDQFIPQQVSLIGIEAQSANYTQGVQLIGTSNNIATVSNVTTVATVTTCGTVTTLANGQTAHSSASTGSPVRIGGRVKTTNDTTLVAGDASDIACTTDQSMVIKPFSVPELDWSFASASGGIVNTTDAVLKAAAAAGLRNYLTSISIQNASATIATEVVIKDGSTVIWRGYVGTSAVLNSAVNVSFPTPLKTTAATALNVACITTGAVVYINAQGYIAP